MKKMKVGIIILGKYYTLSPEEKKIENNDLRLSDGINLTADGKIASARRRRDFHGKRRDRKRRAERGRGGRLRRRSVQRDRHSFRGAPLKKQTDSHIRPGVF